MKKSLLYLIMAIFLLSFVVGCSDSDDDDDDSTSTSTTKGLTGVVIADAALSGAKVCVDKNSNQVCDSDEASATTDASGKYTIDGDTTELAKYSVLVEVPVGAAKVADRVTTATTTTSYLLMAPAGKYAVVSSITTLVQAEYARNLGMKSLENCEKTIYSTMGMSSNANLYADYVNASGYDKEKCIGTLLADTYAAEKTRLNTLAVAADVADTSQTYDATASATSLYNMMLALIIKDELSTAVANVADFYTSNGNSYKGFTTNAVKIVQCTRLTTTNILGFLPLYNYSSSVATDQEALKKILDASSSTSGGEVILKVVYDKTAANNGDRLYAKYLKFAKSTTSTTTGDVELKNPVYNSFTTAVGSSKFIETTGETSAILSSDKRYWLLSALSNGEKWSGATEYTADFKGTYTYDSTTDKVTVLRENGDKSSYKFGFFKTVSVASGLIQSYVPDTLPLVSVIGKAVATGVTDQNQTNAKFSSADYGYQPYLTELSDRYYVYSDGQTKTTVTSNFTIDNFLGTFTCASNGTPSKGSNIVKIMDNPASYTLTAKLTNDDQNDLYASFAQSTGGGSNIILFWRYNTTTGLWTYYTNTGTWEKKTVRNVNLIECTIPSNIASAYSLPKSKFEKVIFAEYKTSKMAYTEVYRGGYIAANTEYDSDSGLFDDYVFNKSAFTSINSNTAKYLKLALFQAGSGATGTADPFTGMVVQCDHASWLSSTLASTGILIPTSGATVTPSNSINNYAYIMDVGCDTDASTSNMKTQYPMAADNYDCSIVAGTSTGAISNSGSGVSVSVVTATSLASNYIACQAYKGTDKIGFAIVPKYLKDGVATGNSAFGGYAGNLEGTVVFTGVNIQITDKRAMNETYTPAGSFTFTIQ